MKQCKRFQGEVILFAFLVLPIWLTWKITQKTFIAGWIIYLTFACMLSLVIHLLRIRYTRRRSGRS